MSRTHPTIPSLLPISSVILNTRGVLYLVQTRTGPKTGLDRIGQNEFGPVCSPQIFLFSLQSDPFRTEDRIKKLKTDFLLVQFQFSFAPYDLSNVQKYSFVFHGGNMLKYFILNQN